MIAITGANGQLGRLVIEALLKSLPASQLVAAVRNPAKAADLAARGIEVREADYDRPATLARAFTGVDKLLLISSSEVGKRVAQHEAAIAAARETGVRLLAYTSLLHADRSVLGLAEEHRRTEAALRASGVPFVLLRNGWYTENYAAAIPPALQYGALLGAAGAGVIASAARRDYADAAAAVLISAEPQAGKSYELAGDDTYTLTRFAAELTRQCGKPVIYRDMREADYKTTLMGAGLPEPVAALYADSDAGAAQGALFDDSHQLSRLIGRPTTRYATVIADALAARR